MSARRQISIVFLALCLVMTWAPVQAVEVAAARPAVDPSPAERLDIVVKAWLKRPEVQNSMVGLEIMDIPSGRVLFNFNANKRFVPASAAKVLTAACAMDTLGPDFRFITRLVAYGPVKGDKVHGDVVLEPSQDPSLELKDLTQMVQSLKDKNIRQIGGTLELLPVSGGFDYFSPSSLVEDWGQDWMPVSSNLVVDHNVAPLRDLGKGLPVVHEPFNRIAENSLTRTLLASGVTPGWASFDLRAGSVRAFRPPTPELGSGGSLIIANPDQYNLAVLTNLARKMGVRVGAKTISASYKGTPEVLVEHASKPLTEVIEVTLKESDNLYAQQLLRALAVKSRRPQERAALEESGLEYLKSWLLKLGIPAREAILFDGCGLSRKNCVSPHALNVVLRHMAGPQANGPFLALMRFEGAGRSRPGTFEFKTGAMDTVRSVSGVLRTAGKETLAVSIIVNGHKVSVGDLRVAFLSLTSQLRHVQLVGPFVFPAPASVSKPRPLSRPRRRIRRARQPTPPASRRVSTPKQAKPITAPAKSLRKAKKS